MRRVAALLMAGGCSFGGPSASPDAGPPIIDAAPDTPTECQAWATRANQVKPCDLPAVAEWNITDAGGTFDTTDGSYDGAGDDPLSAVLTIGVQNGSSFQARVISVQGFSLAAGATLRVKGMHPLIILSWMDVTVAGTIDASSQRGTGGPEPGPGAPRQSCSPAGAGGGTTDSGGGGGGGYQNAGGDGGDGGEAGTAGGMAGPSSAAPEIPLAGCSGGRGGAAATSAAGGHGGGAIQLTARETITVEATGRIHAGGMGGTGGTGEGGGGGGGSGGYIGLDAATVLLVANALLAANGGGGGVGCDGNTTETGEHGEDGKLVTSMAAGGAANSCMSGSRGGAGGALAVPGGGDGTAGGGNGSGGGGGGGGVGYILVWADTFNSSGAASPAIDRM